METWLEALREDLYLSVGCPGYPRNKFRMRNNIQTPYNSAFYVSNYEWIFLSFRLETSYVAYKLYEAFLLFGYYSAFGIYSEGITRNLSLNTFFECGCSFAAELVVNQIYLKNIISFAAEFLIEPYTVIVKFIPQKKFSEGSHGSNIQAICAAIRKCRLSSENERLSKPPT